MKKVIGLIAGLCLAVFAALPVASDAGIMTLIGVGGGSAPALSCSYTPVTTGTQGVAYTGGTPSASGGTPSYTFSETGSLPTGLSISSSTGIISGTPSANGTFTGIQVKVTDSTSTVANCGSAFTLTIAPSATFALTFNQAASLTGGAGPTYDFGTMSYTPGATRVIVAITAISGTPTTTITGVTITVGGVSVALAPVSGTYAIGSANYAAPITSIWESTAPLSGSSGDVQVTASDSLNAFGNSSSVATYSLTTTTPTVSNSNAANTGNNTTLGTTLTVPSGGGGLAIAITGGSTTVSISSTATDAVGTTTNSTFAHTTSTGSLTPTATVSPSQQIALSVASWGP